MGNDDTGRFLVFFVTVIDSNESVSAVTEGLFEEDKIVTGSQSFNVPFQSNTICHIITMEAAGTTSGITKAVCSQLRINSLWFRRWAKIVTEQRLAVCIHR